MPGVCEVQKLTFCTAIIPVCPVRMTVTFFRLVSIISSVIHYRLEQKRSRGPVGWHLWECRTYITQISTIGFPWGDADRDDINPEIDQLTLWFRNRFAPILSALSGDMLNISQQFWLCRETMWCNISNIILYICILYYTTTASSYSSYSLHLLQQDGLLEYPLSSLLICCKF